MHYTTTPTSAPDSISRKQAIRSPESSPFRSEQAERAPALPRPGPRRETRPTWHAGPQRHEGDGGDGVRQPHGAAEVGRHVPDDGGEHPDAGDTHYEAHVPATHVCSTRSNTQSVSVRGAQAGAFENHVQGLPPCFGWILTTWFTNGPTLTQKRHKKKRSDFKMEKADFSDFAPIA